MGTVVGTPAGLAGCHARGGVAGAAGDAGGCAAGGGVAAGGDVAAEGDMAAGGETAAGVGRARGDSGADAGGAADGGDATGTLAGAMPCGVLGATFDGAPGRALGEGESAEFIFRVTAEKGCVCGLPAGRDAPATEMVVPNACRGTSGAGGIRGGSASVSSGEASGGEGASERKRSVSCESLGVRATGRTAGRDVVVARSSIIDGGRAWASTSMSACRPSSRLMAVRRALHSSSAYTERQSGSGSRPRATASSTALGRSGRTDASAGNFGSAMARSTSISAAVPRTMALRPASSSQSSSEAA